MGYNKWYSHTGTDVPSSSILEFFGFSMTTKDGERLRAHTVTEWKKVDDSTYIKEKRPIGFYTEKNGLKDSSLERDYVSEKNKALEERFIESVRKEGKEPTSDYFIWNTRCPSKSIDHFTHHSTISIVVPIIFAVLAALVMLAIAGQGIYEFYLADQAGTTTDPAIGKILLSILGGLIITPLVYVFFSEMFADKPLCKRSKEEQEATRKRYLDSLGEGFSKETGDILREYAIANGYDKIGQYSNNKLSFAIIFLGIIGLLVLLWFEVVTVRVYRVTEMNVEGQENYRITYTYDHAGNMTERAYYDGEGQMTDCVQFEHNSLGVLEKSAAYTVSDGEMSQVSRTTYDDSFCGYSAREVVQDMSYNEVRKVSRSYNINSLVKEQIVYDHKEPVQRTVFEYEKKKLVKQTEFAYDGDEPYEIAFTTYTYDDKGNQTEAKVYRGEQLVSTKTSEYNDKQLIMETYYEYNENGEEILVKKTEYAYDGKHLDRITEYLGEDMIGYQDVECDENGNILQIVGYDVNDEQTGASVSYTYEEFRMWSPRALRLQRERGKDLVIIDKGWF